MGGLHNTSVYGDTWIIKPDADGESFQTFQVNIYDNSPAPRVGHASTTCGNAFVVFGGDTVTNDDGDIDNDIYLFNMNSHTWTIPRPIGKKPSGRYGHTIGVIAIMNFDSKIYLYGGQLDDVVYNDLAVFNLSSFRRPDVQWEWVIPADNIRPPPLTNHTMDVYDNKLWLFGGSTGQKLTNDLWVFDPLSDKWDKPKTFGAIPPPLEEHASVVHKDCLIVHGGKNIQGDALSDVYFLNLVTKTWFKMPSNYALHPQGKFGHTLSTIKGDKLLILGGHLPDFSRVGDNLEPSAEDNGVGTLLNTLDLSNLERLVPGLQQYSTPGNVTTHDRFAGPQSIFTPPSTVSSTISPEKNNISQSPAQQNQTNNDQYSYQNQQQNFQNQGPTGAIIVGSSTGAAAVVSSFTKPSAKGRDEGASSRSVSAEDVFHRERDVLAKTPERKYSGPTPSMSESVTTDLEDENELPLQIPAPVKERHPLIPAPISKEVQNTQYEMERSATSPMPGSLDPPTLNKAIYDDDEEDFQSPAASTDVLYHAFDTQPVEPYLARDSAHVRSSDILDSYVSESPIHGMSDDGIDTVRDSPLKTLSLSTAAGFSTDAASGIAGAAGATGAAIAMAVGVKRVASINKQAVKEKSGMTDSRDVAVAHATSSDAVSSGDRQQFKDIIASLSDELETLRVSTNEQVKAASEKVSLLEAENSELKEKVVTSTPKELETGDEDSYKRKFIRLNTDHQLLNREHDTLKSRSVEIEAVFTQNLIDLQKLNVIIQEQQQGIQAQELELQEYKNLATEHEQLKQRLALLEQENAELQEIKSKTLGESHEEIKKLNTSIDAFLAQYLSKDESSGEYVSKSLVAPATLSDASAGLSAQIEELLKENEDIQASSNSLQEQLQKAQATASEVDELKEKISDLSKVEENYKESLHSVNTATRALQIAQSDLNKEKEVNSKLQHEIDELRLFRSKKASRNNTPTINDFDKENVKSDDDDEEVANAHYNLKVRDLQAELYIIKKERDDLKEEALTLKKKLYNAANPDSF